MGAMGFYLRVGDYTSCGGKIQTGDETLSGYGAAGPREGDVVACGKRPGSDKRPETGRRPAAPCLVDWYDLSRP